jgi:Pentapeptide repeats (8 copies)
MRWLKRDMWKAGIALTGLLIFLAFMVWIPMSARAHEKTLGLSTPVTGTVQATPIANPTIAAETANEQLRKLQLDNERSLNAWLWNNGAAILSSFLSILVIVGGALFGFRRWRVDRRDAQNKDLRAQAEERLKTAVAALGDENEAIQVGGAILLRSFLNPDDEEIYGRYYTQIFDLAVAYLRPSSTSQPSEDSDVISHQPEDPNTALPLTTLRQALIVAFEEALPLVRNKLIADKAERESAGALHSLDATNIQLDNAFLWKADLKQAWMPQASLQEANLYGAILVRADLLNANLSDAILNDADLRGAYLERADLSDASLSGANLSNAVLEGAKLYRVKGLTKEQLEACKAKGAIIDEDTTTSPPQPTTSSSAPSSVNDAQAPSAAPVQVNTPPPSPLSRQK